MLVSFAKHRHITVNRILNSFEQNGKNVGTRAPQVFFYL
jgi:hypothetical protein